jgi:NADH-quinone oxidoreductase subunit M
MILVLLVAAPLVGGLISWPLARWSRLASLLVCLLLLAGALGAQLWFLTPLLAASSGSPQAFFSEVKLPWIPQLGVSFHFAMDGLSYILSALTLAVGILALLASWKRIDHGLGFFHLAMMWVLSGIMGVFLSVDLFLFFFFWEFMLAPMYFIIANWGHEQRGPAALKFFIFTSASGLFMLLSILVLAVTHYRTAGFLSFDLQALAGLELPYRTATLAMLGFSLAFGVKLPVVPLHTWLPDAHTEAPEPGSVILAALLLKTGAYGFIRFVALLFPGPAASLSPVFMGIGIAGIIYGALLSFAQADFKRLVAYSSISHMGFILLGIFSFTTQGFLGALVLILSHGAATGALFTLAGYLSDRVGTRDIRSMGGLLAVIPRLSTAGIVFTLAAIGLPGLGIFTGEMLTLLGAARAGVAYAIAGALGIVLAALYGLRLLQKVFFGQPGEAAGGQKRFWDLTVREAVVMVAFFLAVLWFGVYPQPLFRAVRGSLVSPAHGLSDSPAEASSESR